MFLQELQTDPQMRREFGMRPGGNAVTTRTPSGRQQEESFSADSVLTSVKSMGESAKRKLGLMARAFNTKVKGSGVVPLGSQTQYRSLPGDEGDDSEVVAFENQDGSSMQVRRAGGFGDDDDDSLEDRRGSRRRPVADAGEESKKDL
mmetsp:Transcript_1633/g.3249  ORF Transcript_1633/g.3249 Transcript_1633/m.3249 type:complete len:147 (+) Transcript_1633:460-900(+)